MIVLLPFGTIYLREMTFFALSYIKNKYRSRLEVNDDLWVAISRIKSQIGLLCSKHIAFYSSKKLLHLIVALKLVFEIK